MIQEKALRPIRANAGIEADYRKRLNRLIEAMHKSITYWLSASYRANAPIAQDDSPTLRIRTAIRKISTQWQRNFDRGADELAAWFAQKTKDYSDPALKRILKDAGFSVEFKMSAAMRDAYQAVIGEQVGLIKSIASKHLTQVETIVMQGVQNGRDLGYITKALTEQFGVTKRRAAFIARDQSNKATATLTKTRRLEMGITEAEWMHSGGGKHPRPSHVKAGRERLRFNVAKGALIDGEYIQPGELINCLPGSACIENAAGCKKIWRRWYDGKLTKLITDSGEFIEATPNHPVLTRRGWVPIRLIDLGEDVFSVSDQVVFGSEKDVDDSEHGIAKIFDLAALHVGVNTSTSTAFKFHGDAIDQEVDTVDIAGFLPNDFSTKRAQAICESFFPDAYVAIIESGLSVDGAHAATLNRLFCAPDSVIGGFGACLSLLRSHLSHADDVRLRLTARLNSCQRKASADHVAADPKGGCEREFAFASFIPGNDLLIRQLISLIFAASVRWCANTASAEFLGEIVGVHSDSSGGISESASGAYNPLRVIDKSFRDFSGHVYNLETATGWYSSRGLIYHNCRCVSRPLVKGFID